MSRSKRMFAVLVLCLGCGMVFAPAAAAYIDPGSGSYIIQILAATVLGIGVAIGVFWTRLRSFVGRLFGKKER